MKVANYLNRTDEADDPLAEFEKILKEVAAHPEIEELYFKGALLHKSNFQINNP